MIHAARVEKSARLQRVLAVLRRNVDVWMTRRELRVVCGPEMEDATVCIRELRQNGYRIDCERRDGRWKYRLVEAAQRTLFVLLFVPWSMLAATGI